jgi:hypothetical protein
MPGLNKLFILIGALFLFWGISAHSSDGILEINQACAVNTGCFNGDTAGFPVTLTSSGSYLLTSNLNVSGEPSPQDVTAILIQPTDHVTLDLNGFLISGPGVVGTGDGINGFPSSENVTVINGTIRGMGDFGVQLDRRAKLARLTVENNGSDGINVDIFSMVVECIAHSNGNDGIVAPASIVRGNTADQNGDDGIQGGSGSTVIGNRASFNTGFGLNLGSGSGYADNSIYNNTAGTVFSGVEMGTNVCDGNTTCP